MEYDFENDAAKKVDEAFRSSGRANILIVGRTGVGKSTLLNAVFGRNLAETGVGRPVTKETRQYCREDLPVCIFDTRGLELAKYKETLAELRTFLAKQNRTSDPFQHVHVAWVCVAEDSARVEEGEAQACAMLTDYMPVVAVVTKSRSADETFRNKVQELLPEAKNVVRVRALREVLEDGHALPPRGLVELVELTAQVMPEGQVNAFIAAQRVSLEKKRDSARKIVAGAATSAGTAALVPVPIADAAMIIPIQVGMLAGISFIFGLEMKTKSLSTLIASAATSYGAPLAGRYILTGLLKLFPPTAAPAEMVSAATAVAITTAVGELYISVLMALCSTAQNSPPSPEDVSTAFRAALLARRAESH